MFIIPQKIILDKNETKRCWTQDSEWWLIWVDGGRGIGWENHTIRFRLLPRSWFLFGVVVSWVLITLLKINTQAGHT